MTIPFGIHFQHFVDGWPSQQNHDPVNAPPDDRPFNKRKIPVRRSDSPNQKLTKMDAANVFHNQQCGLSKPKRKTEEAIDTSTIKIEASVLKIEIEMTEDLSLPWTTERHVQKPFQDCAEEDVIPGLKLETQPAPCSPNGSQWNFNGTEVLELIAQDNSDLEDYNSDEESECSDIWDVDDVQENSNSDFSMENYIDPNEAGHNVCGHSEHVDDGSVIHRSMYNDDEDPEYMYEWVRDTSNFPLNAPFGGVPKLNLPDSFPTMPSPEDFYRLFIDADLVKLLKIETNRYAKVICEQKKAEEEIQDRSITNTWKPVSEAEMNCFIAILIHMGLVNKPKISDYWAIDPSLHTTFASRLLKRDRFCQILAFFHLNDNMEFIPLGQPGHDPLHKLRPFFDHILQKFKSLYSPEENICIDEAICPWRGQSLFRVYMRDKPNRLRFKLYELCESSSGYVCNMEIMCHAPNVSNTPFDVCRRLVDSFLGLGHTLYVDTYYCNPALAEFLSANDTQLVGTVRANRVGLPKDLVNKPMKTGELDFRRKNQVLYLRWNDKQEVHMITTRHLPEMREQQFRSGHKKLKPTCIIDYTANMAGVDKSDQMISYLPLHRKTVKWWKKLSFHLLTLVMIQSHILYNKFMKSKKLKTIRLDAFVKSVCNNFAAVLPQEEDENVTGAAAMDVGADIGRLLPGNHWPENNPLNKNQTRKTQLSCRVCLAKMRHRKLAKEVIMNKRKLTSFRCRQCKVSLCIDPCFRLFHTVKNYHL